VEFTSINGQSVPKSLWEIDANEQDRKDALNRMSSLEGNFPEIKGTFTDEISKIGYGSSPYFFEYRIYTEAQLEAGVQSSWDKDKHEYGYTDVTTTLANPALTSP